MWRQPLVPHGLHFGRPAVIMRFSHSKHDRNHPTPMNVMTTHVRRAPAIAPLLACAAFLTTACTGDDTADRGATVRYDTVGDTIIARAQQAPAWGDSARLVEEVRIGELEGEDEYTFGRVVSMAVDSAGAMYVLDQQALTVRVYDATGRHVRDIGRSGSGPGELKQPHSLDFMPDGRLAVRDFGNARINFYDATGESVGTLTIPGGFFTSTPMQVDTLGRIYTSVVADRPEGQMFRVGYQRFGADGSIGDTIRRPRPDFETQPLTARSPDGSGMSATSVPFSPGIQWTIDRGGNVVWAITSDYSIHTMQDGRPFRITRTIDAVPVQAAEKAAAEENIVRNMQATQPNWSWQGPAIPDAKPFIGSVTIAHDGRIWVQVRQPGERQAADPDAEREPGAPPPIDQWPEPQVYDVFEPDGTWLARLDAPAQFTPMYMRGDHVWGMQRDEYDVNYVVRLRIDR